MQYVFYATLKDWKIASCAGVLYIEGLSYGNPRYGEGTRAAFTFDKDKIDFDARQYKTESAVYKLV